MKIVLSWLREFVPFTVEPAQLAKDLSLIGLTVNSVTPVGEETVLEIDVTTNRPDCLSHHGIAREVAARYQLTVAPVSGMQPTESEIASDIPKIRPRARRKDAMIEIFATELCRRYSARLIRGVEVKPSAEKIARRLELVGIRSINNIADATNYALMAYGHPMHAFDLDRLEGGRIIVRRAAQGEHLTTLDGIERTLTAEDLVIADAKRPVALAGVMGGLDTEISSGTKNVLLESAWFDPVSVRRTSKRHGLHTEASHRFERGADIEATLSSAGYCMELIHDLAGGAVDTVVDAYPKPPARPAILLRHFEIARHLGMEIPPEEVERILLSLGILPRAKGRSGWSCTIPSHRVDLTREIDLVEEVARLYGYERFPLRLPATPGEATHHSSNMKKSECLRETMLALGYDEIISAVMVSKAEAAYGEGEPVQLQNPLSEEAAVLRTSLVPGLLSAIQWNMNRGQQDARLFEIGNAYFSKPGGAHREPPVLAVAAMGNRWPEQIGRSAAPFDFYDLKGDVSQLLGHFDMLEPTVDSLHLPQYFRPGHAARVTLGNHTAARLGQLHPQEAERWKFRLPIFIAELFLDIIYAHPLHVPRNRTLSRYPAVHRDFSVVLPDNVLFEAVRSAVASAGVAELIAIEPVEVFRGAAAGAGHYSLLLRVTLQSDQATLTEAELTERSARIIQALEARVGARIRMTA